MDIGRLRQDLLDVTQDLVDDFPELPAGAVIRCVARCRDELLVMGVRDGLGEATAAMAARRLEHRVGGRQPVSAGGVRSA